MSVQLPVSAVFPIISTLKTDKNAITTGCVKNTEIRKICVRHGMRTAHMSLLISLLMMMKILRTEPSKFLTVRQRSAEEEFTDRLMSLNSD